jgi:hypothetical protein
VSSRIVTIVLLAGAIGSSLLAFYFLRSDEAPATRAESAVVAPSPGGDSEVASQAGESGETAGGPAEAQSRPPPAKAPGGQAQPGPGSSTPPFAGDFPREPPSEAEELEKVFASEAVDPAWGPSMEATLYEQIGEIAGSEVVTVRTECKTTLCRLQVTQRVPVQAGRSPDESPVMYEMYEALFARLGFESRSITSTSDANGIVSSVVYLPRGDSASSD